MAFRATISRAPIVDLFVESANAVRLLLFFAGVWWVVEFALGVCLAVDVGLGLGVDLGLGGGEALRL